MNVCVLREMDSKQMQKRNKKQRNSLVREKKSDKDLNNWEILSLCKQRPSDIIITLLEIYLKEIIGQIEKTWK